MSTGKQDFSQWKHKYMAKPEQGYGQPKPQGIWDVVMKNKFAIAGLVVVAYYLYRQRKMQLARRKKLEKAKEALRAAGSFRKSGGTNNIGGTPSKAPVAPMPALKPTAPAPAPSPAPAPAQVPVPPEVETTADPYFKPFPKSN